MRKGDTERREVRKKVKEGKGERERERKKVTIGLSGGREGGKDIR